jgi:hypothetical protein
MVLPMENEKHDKTEDGKTNYGTILSAYKDIDISAIISMIGGISFLAGWVYDLGYFYVLNFKLLSVLNINDHVLATLTYLPGITAVVAFILADKVFTPTLYMDDIIVTEILQWIGYAVKVLFITSIFVFLYRISPSADVSDVLLMGGLGSFFSFTIASAAKKRYLVSRKRTLVITLFWVTVNVLGLISYFGAYEAALDLKQDRLTDIIQTKNQQIALIRILSNGMLGIDVAHQDILFVPNSEILSVSSRVNKTNSSGNPSAHSP